MFLMRKRTLLCVSVRPGKEAVALSVTFWVCACLSIIVVLSFGQIEQMD